MAAMTTMTEPNAPPAIQRAGIWVPNKDIDLPLPSVLEGEEGRLNISRRAFLGVSAAAGGLALSGIPLPGHAAAPASAVGSRPSWPRPSDVRQVWLHRQATGESVVARYFDGNSIDVRDYVACCKILRDVTANHTVQIDLRLLDLLFAIQKWLVSWGIDRPLVIHSGYRTERTNRGLEGAARNSRHLRGQAADIRIQGIPASYLARLASVFGQGGVGFYIDRGFVHVDVGGTPRYWVMGSR